VILPGFRPHQQQCRSNVRLCRKNRSTCSIDNVASTLLLVWTGRLKKTKEGPVEGNPPAVTRRRYTVFDELTVANGPPTEAPCRCTKSTNGYCKSVTFTQFGVGKLSSHNTYVGPPDVGQKCTLAASQ